MMMWFLFHNGWFFTKLPAGSTYDEALAAQWSEISLPHDFLIGQHQNLYETCDGWYRRMLTVDEKDADRVWLLRFDGVYMDCDILLNGRVICTHHYGYTAFDAVLHGLHAGENEIVVHIRHRSPNSRWYSGAGIFRDVTLHVLDKRYIPLDGVYVSMTRQEKKWNVLIETEINGEGEVQPEHTLADVRGRKIASAKGTCARFGII
jgi:beta-galactosidase